jgi:hypothetical protein
MWGGGGRGNKKWILEESPSPRLIMAGHTKDSPEDSKGKGVIAHGGFDWNTSWILGEYPIKKAKGRDSTTQWILGKSSQYITVMGKGYYHTVVFRAGRDYHTIDFGILGKFLLSVVLGAVLLLQKEFERNPSVGAVCTVSLTGERVGMRPN